MALTVSLSSLLQIFVEQHTESRPSALISHWIEKISSTLEQMSPLIFQEFSKSLLKEIAQHNSFQALIVSTLVKM